MANHKSAAKRARQSPRRQAVNSRRKSTVRTYEKNLVKAIGAKETTSLPELLKSFTSQIMKAAKSSSMTKKTAARKISRLSTRVWSALNAK